LKGFQEIVNSGKAKKKAEKSNKKVKRRKEKKNETEGDGEWSDKQPLRSNQDWLSSGKMRNFFFRQESWIKGLPRCGFEQGLISRIQGKGDKGGKMQQKQPRTQFIHFHLLPRR